ncbi:uncharacterized protein LOC133188872 isoform X2 [Saccostrea echinata]|uniref:uncharacterized protein LOC133188872 isoform X2 n=1 Tax=Saccostrea echinata TaxID=191078 RepID=UPI002A806736|nr:uncharacterized protein LOC133188872 isoform X2 [Saccostrea echinata]
MVRLGDFPWNFLAILLFVLLGQHTYVLCKFAYSFTLDFHGPYAPRDTYNTSCYAEASGEDSVSDVDVYLSFGSITYCNNSQVVPVGRNQSCSEATVQNRTTYYFSLPDLRISDSGTYSCKIHNKTTGALKISIHQNISVTRLVLQLKLKFMYQQRKLMALEAPRQFIPQPSPYFYLC